MPLEKYLFHYFDGMDLVMNSVRISYLSLSALNNVLTFEYIDQKDGKLILIACQLQMGSIVKLSMPNSMFLRNRHLNPTFDEKE